VDISLAPAEAGRVDDVLEILGAGPDLPHCTCQYWRFSSGDFGRTSQAGRIEALRQQARDEPAPGMLAYVDGVPAGWCGFGVRPRLGRLVRSRTIPRIDDLPVWSVFCFVVRTGYRRQGLAARLLDGVIDYGRRLRAPALEAYPIDPQGSRVSTTFAYVGTVGMFERAGFEKVVLTGSKSAGLPRWLMRLNLEPPPTEARP
jgi:GNAT superfamily N-acetyltransferase